MNLFPYILGPVWVLDVTLTPDGHTIAAWRCKMGCEPQQTVYDAAAVAKGVAVVTVSGHGTIVKPADSQLAARVRDDRATFLWREHDGRIAFVRRERLQGVGVLFKVLFYAKNLSYRPKKKINRMISGRI